MSDQVPAGFEEVPAGFELAPAAKTANAPGPSRQSEIPAGFEEVPAGFELAPEPKSSGLNVSKDSSSGQPQEPEKKGLWQQTKDMITGNDRETKATQELPELQNSGLLDGIEMSDTKRAAVTSAIALTPDPSEVARILQAVSPDIGIQQDEKGNWLAANNKTGVRTVINKPGLSALDGYQTAAQGAAYAAAAIGTRGRSLGATAAITAGKSAATEALIQALQKSQGGDFDLTDVGASAVGGALGEAGAKGLSLVGHGARNVLTGRAARAAAESLPADTEDVTSAIIKASRNGSDKNIDKVVEAIAPKKEVIEAADRLGITDDLLASHVSGNQRFVANAQVAASVPGSKLREQELQAVKSVGDQAEKLITDFGGKIDKSEVSDRVITRTHEIIKDMKDQASQLYGQVDAAIPGNTKVDVSSSIAFLQNKAATVGNKLLTQQEKQTLSILKDKPTYAGLDLIRRQVGEAERKNTGPFANTDSATLGALKRVLAADQDAAVVNAGLGTELRDAQKLVAQRKQLEASFMKVSGKSLQGAVVPKVGTALKNLGKGDFKAFDETMGAIHPEMREEVMMTALNDAFTQGSRDSKSISVPGFVKWYDGLNRNPEAMKRMAQYMPAGAKERMDDIHTVARGIWEADKSNIQTGRLGEATKAFDKKDGFLSRLYGFGSKVAMAEGVATPSGLPGFGATSVIASTLVKGRSGEPVMQAADGMLSSAKLRNAAFAYARDGKSKAAADAEQALKKSSVYIKWLSHIGSGERAKVAAMGPMQYLFKGGESDNTNSEE
jgi:hypothetical protein